MKYSPVLVVAFALVCLLSGISFQACASPGTPAGKLIFEDDFSDAKSGWTSPTNDIGGGKYSSGQYVLSLNKKDMMQIASREKMEDISDFSVEVDCTGVSLAGETSIGEIVFRLQSDYSGMYLFAVCPVSGTFAVTRKYNGKWANVANFPSSNFVKKGQSTNRLKVTCLNSEVTVFMNGAMLLTFTDRLFTRGKIGLAVESIGVPSCSYAFDNFKLYALP
jgi:hypothetical protein